MGSTSPHAFLCTKQWLRERLEAYARQLIERACKDDIAVVGITDYFTIQGYIALKKLLADAPALKALVGEELAKRATEILFLPNIELRTSIIVRDRKNEDSRVNFHVFFSDAVSPEDIDEHFLRELKFTAEANPDSKDERWSLTPQSLTDLGKKLKNQHEKFQQHSDMSVGMMNAVVKCGEELGITDDEITFDDALAVNESAGQTVSAQAKLLSPIRSGKAGPTEYHDQTNSLPMAIFFTAFPPLRWHRKRNRRCPGFPQPS